uniref:SWI/SNF complex subunit SMARCC2 n=1 Tax=Steinernema glaseri TaxID=37863 RepID=A0A1I8AAF7_9BILA
MSSKRGGSNPKRSRRDEDVDMEEEENSRSGGLTMVNIPAGREKDTEFQAPKGQKTLTDMDTEDQVTNVEKDTEPNAVEQTHYIVVPSYSAWFDYNAIHQIEKRGLPEFFNGQNKSKTAEVYMAYRNFMIDTYRLNPFEYLSFTACRRNLAGDVCAILRVHSFLERWGLINYQVDAESRPAPIAPPSTSHFNILADTPMGVQTINPIPSNFSSASAEVKKEQKDGEEVKQEPGTSAAKNISHVGLKTDQYRKQLIAMQAKGCAPGREWTDQETLLLLEGLEMFKDDWNKVADHVGTRTQEECILKFLQLPIVDPYLEEDDIETEMTNHITQQPIPFSQTGNPVMSTVAFLSSVVDKRVAASAVKAALEEFGKLKDEVPSLMIEAHAKNIDAVMKDEDNIDGTVGLSRSGIAGQALPKNQSEEKKGESKDGEAMDTSESTEKPSTENGAEEGDVNVSELRAKAKRAVSEKVQAAAASALAAAAVKAKHLATIEERRIKSLVAQLVETQMKKLEMKLRHFDELEQILDKEREALEYQRQQLILERQAFHMDQLRYLEQRAKHDAHVKLVAGGHLPQSLPPGFEVSGPAAPQAQVQVALPPSAVAQAAGPHPEQGQHVQGSHQEQQHPQGHPQVAPQHGAPQQQPPQQTQTKSEPMDTDASRVQSPPTTSAPPSAQHPQVMQQHQPPVAQPPPQQAVPQQQPVPQQPPQHPPTSQQQYAYQPPPQQGGYGGPPQAYQQGYQQPYYQQGPPQGYYQQGARPPYPQQQYAQRPPYQQGPPPQQGYPQQGAPRHYAPPPPQGQYYPPPQGYPQYPPQYQGQPQMAAPPQSSDDAATPPMHQGHQG